MSQRFELLQRLKLLRGEPPEEPLRTLCHHDYLVGGMSIAIDVKPDEVLGQLLLAIGGEARGLRVLDIRGRRPWVFSVKLEGKQHEWELDGLEALVDTLNAAFAAHADIKAIAQLGEWEDMLQVWVLPKKLLPTLMVEDWFKPTNPASLDALAWPAEPAR